MAGCGGRGTAPCIPSENRHAVQRFWKKSMPGNLISPQEQRLVIVGGAGERGVWGVRCVGSQSHAAPLKRTRDVGYPREKNEVT